MFVTLTSLVVHTLAITCTSNEQSYVHLLLHTLKVEIWIRFLWSLQHARATVVHGREDDDQVLTIDTCMLVTHLWCDRRLKCDVLDQLPSKQRQMVCHYRDYRVIHTGIVLRLY